MKKFWKNQRVQGFLAGVLCCGLMLSLCGVVYAASRDITVSDGIKILINGKAFQPKDAKGNPVELFNYNGTVYAPVRALCEQIDLKVSYDSATKTVSVTTPSTPASGSQNEQKPSGQLTAEQARQAALNHAKLTAEKVTFLKTKLDTDDGRTIYEVEFFSDKTEYEYDIDATTGKVLKSEQKAYSAPSGGTGTAITEAKAKEIALAKAPGATVVKCKRDWEDSVEVFELELRKGTTEYECEIEIATGEILKWEEDHD